MQQTKPHRLFLRTVAYLVLVFFTANSTFTYAQGIEFGKEIKIENLADRIEIPESLGVMKEKYLANNSSPLILHIEDAHAQTDAQQNIEKLLNHLEQQNGFKTLFLEGGVKGKISKNLLRFFENDKINQEVAHKLLEKAVVTGPGIFLLKHHSDPKVKAYGVEEKDLYEKHLLSFRKVYKRKPESDKFLIEYKSKLEAQNSKLNNLELKKFLKDWFLFREDKTDLLNHLSVLDGFSEKYLSLNLHDARNQLEFPMLIRFFKLKDLEKTVSREAYLVSRKKEEQKLIKWIKNNHQELFLKDFEFILNSNHDASRFTKYEIRSLLERFYASAHPKGFTFKDYPHLTKDFAQWILSEELNGELLFKEIELITERITTALLKTEEEKEIIQKLKDYLLLKKLFSLELTREEWGQIKVKNGSRIWHLASREEKKNRIFAGKLHSLKNTRYEIRDTLHAARRFYTLAERRERTVFQNFIGTLQQNKIERTALVMGGFHTEGFQEFLRNNKISYVTISPNIRELEGSKLYLDKMIPRAISAVPPALLDTKPFSVITQISHRDANARELALRSELDKFPDQISGSAFQEHQIRSELRSRGRLPIIPGLLEKFRGQLINLNVSQAAKIMNVTRQALSKHLEGHPEDLTKYKLRKEEFHGKGIVRHFVQIDPTVKWIIELFQNDPTRKILPRTGEFVKKFGPGERAFERHFSRTFKIVKNEIQKEGFDQELKKRIERAIGLHENLPLETAKFIIELFKKEPNRTQLPFQRELSHELGPHQDTFSHHFSEILQVLREQIILPGIDLALKARIDLAITAKEEWIKKYMETRKSNSDSLRSELRTGDKKNVGKKKIIPKKRIFWIAQGHQSKMSMFSLMFSTAAAVWTLYGSEIQPIGFMNQIEIISWAFLAAAAWSVVPEMLVNFIYSGQKSTFVTNVVGVSLRRFEMFNLSDLMIFIGIVGIGISWFQRSPLPALLITAAPFFWLYISSWWVRRTQKIRPSDYEKYYASKKLVKNQLRADRVFKSQLSAALILLLFSFGARLIGWFESVPGLVWFTPVSVIGILADAILKRLAISKFSYFGPSESLYKIIGRARSELPRRPIDPETTQRADSINRRSELRQPDQEEGKIPEETVITQPKQNFSAPEWDRQTRDFIGRWRLERNPEKKIGIEAEFTKHVKPALESLMIEYENDREFQRRAISLRLASGYPGHVIREILENADFRMWSMISAIDNIILKLVNTQRILNKPLKGKAKNRSPRAELRSIRNRRFHPLVRLSLFGFTLGLGTSGFTGCVSSIVYDVWGINHVDDLRNFPEDLLQNVDEMEVPNIESTGDQLRPIDFKVSRPVREKIEVGLEILQEDPKWYEYVVRQMRSVVPFVTADDVFALGNALVVQEKKFLEANDSPDGNAGLFVHEASHMKGSGQAEWVRAKREKLAEIYGPGILNNQAVYRALMEFHSEIERARYVFERLVRRANGKITEDAVTQYRIIVRSAKRELLEVVEAEHYNPQRTIPFYVSPETLYIHQLIRTSESPSEVIPANFPFRLFESGWIEFDEAGNRFIIFEMDPSKAGELSKHVFSFPPGITTNLAHFQNLKPFQYSDGLLLLGNLQDGEKNDTVVRFNMKTEQSDSIPLPFGVNSEDAEVKEGRWFQVVEKFAEAYQREWWADLFSPNLELRDYPVPVHDAKTEPNPFLEPYQPAELPKDFAHAPPAEWAQEEIKFGADIHETRYAVSKDQTRIAYWVPFNLSGRKHPSYFMYFYEKKESGYELWNAKINAPYDEELLEMYFDQDGRQLLTIWGNQFYIEPWPASRAELRSSKRQVSSGVPKTLVFGRSLEENVRRDTRTLSELRRGINENAGDVSGEKGNREALFRQPLVKLLPLEAAIADLSYLIASSAFQKINRDQQDENQRNSNYHDHNIVGFGLQDKGNDEAGQVNGQNINEYLHQILSSLLGQSNALAHFLVSPIIFAYYSIINLIKIISKSPDTVNRKEVVRGWPEKSLQFARAEGKPPSRLIVRSELRVGEENDNASPNFFSKEWDQKARDLIGQWKFARDREKANRLALEFTTHIQNAVETFLTDYEKKSELKQRTVSFKETKYLKRVMEEILESINLSQTRFISTYLNDTLLRLVKATPVSATPVSRGKISGKPRASGTHHKKQVLLDFLVKHAGSQAKLEELLKKLEQENNPAFTVLRLYLGLTTDREAFSFERISRVLFERFQIHSRHHENKVAGQTDIVLMLARAVEAIFVASVGDPETARKILTKMPEKQLPGSLRLIKGKWRASEDLVRRSELRTELELLQPSADGALQKSEKKISLIHQWIGWILRLASILIIFPLWVFIFRPLSINIHEMGHAIAGQFPLMYVHGSTIQEIEKLEVHWPYFSHLYHFLTSPSLQSLRSLMSYRVQVDTNYFSQHMPSDLSDTFYSAAGPFMNVVPLVYLLFFSVPYFLAQLKKMWHNAAKLKLPSWKDHSKFVLALSGLVWAFYEWRLLIGQAMMDDSDYAAMSLRSGIGIEAFVHLFIWSPIFIYLWSRLHVSKPWMKMVTRVSLPLAFAGFLCAFYPYFGSAATLMSGIFLMIAFAVSYGLQFVLQRETEKPESPPASSLQKSKWKPFAAPMFATLIWFFGAGGVLTLTHPSRNLFRGHQLGIYGSFVPNVVDRFGDVLHRGDEKAAREILKYLTKNRKSRYPSSVELFFAALMHPMYGDAAEKFLGHLSISDMLTLQLMNEDPLGKQDVIVAARYDGQLTTLANEIYFKANSNYKTDRMNLASNVVEQIERLRNDFLIAPKIPRVYLQKGFIFRGKTDLYEALMNEIKGKSPEIWKAMNEETSLLDKIISATPHTPRSELQSSKRQVSNGVLKTLVFGRSLEGNVQPAFRALSELRASRKGAIDAAITSWDYKIAILKEAALRVKNREKYLEGIAELEKFFDSDEFKNLETAVTQILFPAYDPDEKFGDKPAFTDFNLIERVDNWLTRVSSTLGSYDTLFFTERSEEIKRVFKRLGRFRSQFPKKDEWGTFYAWDWNVQKAIRLTEKFLTEENISRQGYLEHLGTVTHAFTEFGIFRETRDGNLVGTIPQMVMGDINQLRDELDFNQFEGFPVIEKRFERTRKNLEHMSDVILKVIKATPADIFRNSDSKPFLQNAYFNVNRQLFDLYLAVGNVELKRFKNIQERIVEHDEIELWDNPSAWDVHRAGSDLYFDKARVYLDKAFDWYVEIGKIVPLQSEYTALANAEANRIVIIQDLYGLDDYEVEEELVLMNRDWVRSYKEGSAFALGTHIDRIGRFLSFRKIPFAIHLIHEGIWDRAVLDILSEGLYTLEDARGMYRMVSIQAIIRFLLLHHLSGKPDLEKRLYQAITQKDNETIQKVCSEADGDQQILRKAEEIFARLTNLEKKLRLRNYNFYSHNLTVEGLKDSTPLESANGDLVIERKIREFREKNPTAPLEATRVEPEKLAEYVDRDLKRYLIGKLSEDPLFKGRENAVLLLALLYWEQGIDGWHEKLGSRMGGAGLHQVIGHWLNHGLFYRSSKIHQDRAVLKSSIEIAQTLDNDDFTKAHISGDRFVLERLFVLLGFIKGADDIEDARELSKLDVVEKPVPAVSAPAISGEVIPQPVGSTAEPEKAASVEEIVREPEIASPVREDETPELISAEQRRVPAEVDEVVVEEKELSYTLIPLPESVKTDLYNLNDPDLKPESESRFFVRIRIIAAARNISMKWLANKLGETEGPFRLRLMDRHGEKLRTTVRKDWFPDIAKFLHIPADLIWGAPEGLLPPDTFAPEPIDLILRKAAAKKRERASTVSAASSKLVSRTETQTKLRREVPVEEAGLVQPAPLFVTSEEKQIAKVLRKVFDIDLRLKALIIKRIPEDYLRIEFYKIWNVNDNFYPKNREDHFEVAKIARKLLGVKIKGTDREGVETYEDAWLDPQTKQSVEPDKISYLSILLDSLAHDVLAEILQLVTHFADLKIDFMGGDEEGLLELVTNPKPDENMMELSERDLRLLASRFMARFDGSERMRILRQFEEAIQSSVVAKPGAPQVRQVSLPAAVPATAPRPVPTPTVQPVRPVTAAPVPVRPAQSTHPASVIAVPVRPAVPQQPPAPKLEGELAARVNFLRNIPQNLILFRTALYIKWTEIKKIARYSSALDADVVKKNRIIAKDLLGVSEGNKQFGVKDLPTDLAYYVLLRNNLMKQIFDDIFEWLAAADDKKWNSLGFKNPAEKQNIQKLYHDIVQTPRAELRKSKVQTLARLIYRALTYFPISADYLPIISPPSGDLSALFSDDEKKLIRKMINDLDKQKTYPRAFLLSVMEHLLPSPDSELGARFTRFEHEKTTSSVPHAVFPMLLILSCFFVFEHFVWGLIFPNIWIALSSAGLLYGLLKSIGLLENLHQRYFIQSAYHDGYGYIKIPVLKSNDSTEREFENALKDKIAEAYSSWQEPAQKRDLFSPLFSDGQKFLLRRIFEELEESGEFSFSELEVIKPNLTLLVPQSGIKQDYIFERISKFIKAKFPNIHEIRRDLKLRRRVRDMGLIGLGVLMFYNLLNGNPILFWFLPILPIAWMFDEHFLTNIQTKIDLINMEVFNYSDDSIFLSAATGTQFEASSKEKILETLRKRKEEEIQAGKNMDPGKKWLNRIGTIFTSSFLLLMTLGSISLAFKDAKYLKTYEVLQMASFGAGILMAFSFVGQALNERWIMPKLSRRYQEKIDEEIQKRSELRLAPIEPSTVQQLPPIAAMSELRANGAEKHVRNYAKPEYAQGELLEPPEFVKALGKEVRRVLPQFSRPADQQITRIQRTPEQLEWQRHKDQFFYFVDLKENKWYAVRWDRNGKKLTKDYVAFNMDRGDDEGIYIFTDGKLAYRLTLPSAVRSMRQQQILNVNKMRGSMNEILTLITQLVRRPDLTYYWLGYDNQTSEFTMHEVVADKKVEYEKIVVPKIALDPSASKHIADFVGVDAKRHVVSIGEAGLHRFSDLARKFSNTIEIFHRKDKLGRTLYLFTDEISSAGDILQSIGGQEQGVVRKMLDIIEGREKHEDKKWSLPSLIYMEHRFGKIVRTFHLIGGENRRLQVDDRVISVPWAGEPTHYHQLAKTLRFMRAQKNILQNEERKRKSGHLEKRKTAQFSDTLIDEIKHRDPDLLVFASAAALALNRGIMRSDMLELLVQRMLEGRKVLVLTYGPHFDWYLVNAIRTYMSIHPNFRLNPEITSEVLSRLYLASDYTGYVYGFRDGWPYVFSNPSLFDLDSASLNIRKKIVDAMYKVGRELSIGIRNIRSERGSLAVHFSEPKVRWQKRFQFVERLREELKDYNLQINATSSHSVVISILDRASVIQHIMKDELGIPQNKVLIAASSMNTKHEINGRIITQFPDALLIFTGDQLFMPMETIPANVSVWPAPAKGHEGTFSILSALPDRFLGSRSELRSSKLDVSSEVPKTLVFGRDLEANRETLIKALFSPEGIVRRAELRKNENHYLFAGTEIKIRREIARIPRETVAKAVGMKYEYFAQFERGERLIRPEQIRAIHLHINQIQGAIVRERREAAELTLEEVAREMNSSGNLTAVIGTINRFESGRSISDAKFIKHLHRTIDQLQRLKLRARRKLLGITRPELAYAVGFKKELTIWRIEKGITIPNPKQIEKLYFEINRLGGLKIKELMEAARLSEDQVAKASGISKAYLTKIKAGYQGNMSPEIVRRIQKSIRHLSGKWLRERRLAGRVGIQELADHIDRNPNTVADIENKFRNVPAKRYEEFHEGITVLTGAKIQSLRQIGRLGVIAIAREAKITEAYLSRAEKGQTEMKPADLDKVFKAIRRLTGEKVRKHRELLKLSLQELADLADVHVKTIRNLEEGNGQIDIDALYLVHAAMNMKRDVKREMYPRHASKKHSAGRFDVVLENVSSPVKNQDDADSDQNEQRMQEIKQLIPRISTDMGREIVRLMLAGNDIDVIAHIMHIAPSDAIGVLKGAIEEVRTMMGVTESLNSPRTIKLSDFFQSFGEPQKFAAARAELRKVKTENESTVHLNAMAKVAKDAAAETIGPKLRSELRTKIPALLEQFRDRLNGLNITEAAKRIGASIPGLSLHLQNHPEDFDKYGIEKQEAIIPTRLEQFGQSKLNGLNITEAAKRIGASISGLSRYLQNHPEDFDKYGIEIPTDIPTRLEQFGQSKLNGLNITEAAKRIGASIPGLSLHLQNHPDDFKKYGIEKQEAIIPTRLEQFGQSKLNGLNITEAAKRIGASIPGLSRYLQNHPEDFDKYGIEKQEAIIPTRLEQFGQSKLNGLNITQVAKRIGASQPGLSFHLQNHPEDFEKYGIHKGNRSELRENLNFQIDVVKTVAAEAAEKTIGMNLRSELRLVVYDLLFPTALASTDREPSKLEMAIQQSTRKITAVVVVPKDLNPEEMEHLVRGVVVALGQKTPTHRVTLLVNNPENFRRVFNRTLDQLRVPIDQKKSLTTRIQFSTREEFASSTNDLKDQNVVIVAPSGDPISVKLNAKSLTRLVTDRLLDQTALSKSELRSSLGSFVTGAFETLLLPAQDQTHFAKKDGFWYAISKRALGLIQSLIDSALQSKLVLKFA